MINQESKEVWDEVKNLWKNSSQTKDINIQLSGLVTELKGKVSQFEKDSIKGDIDMITRSISQFEKDSISRDIDYLSKFVRKILDRIKGKK